MNQVKNQVLRDICLNDFEMYLRWSFKKKYNSKIILKDFHFKIIQALQDVYNGKIKNLCINLPPRIGKTTFTNHFLEWTLTKHPEAKNIMTSYSDMLVTNSSQSIRDMLGSKEHNEIFNIDVKKDTQSKKMWKTELDGGIYAVSSFGQITGFGAGLKTNSWGGCIIIDDPLKTEDSNSHLMLNKIKEWYQTTLSNRVNSPRTPIILIMQRLHTDDLAGQILQNTFEDKEDWEFLTIKMYDEDKKKSIWEDTVPTKKLEQIKKSNSSYFYSQYQQDPIIKGGNFFKVDWIKWVANETISSIKFDKKFITVDTALKDKQQNDYTVYSSFGVYDNKLYWLDMYRGKPRSTEREITATEFYNKHDTYPFSGMHIEQKASGVDLFQRLKDKGLMVYEIERDKDKIYRAETISPYIETHNIYINENIPHKIDLLTEYESFPNSKHDDIIDTLLDGVEICYKNDTSNDYSWLYD